MAANKSDNAVVCQTCGCEWNCHMYLSCSIVPESGEKVKSVKKAEVERELQTLQEINREIAYVLTTTPYMVRRHYDLCLPVFSLFSLGFILSTPSLSL